MGIEPEVIPDSSNEGNDAISTFPDLRLIFIIILISASFIFVLRAIVPLILMLIGVVYLFKQYNKLTQTEE